MTPHLCSFPYCPNVVEGPGRCSEHPYPRRSRNAGGVTAGGYGGRRWRETARAYRAEHPVCEMFGCDQPTTIVHHLDGRGPLGPRGLDWINLAGLCAHHHRLEHAHPGSLVL